MTPTRKAHLKDKVGIYCLTTEISTDVIRLFKVENDGKRERPLAQSSSYIVYQLSNVTAEDAGTYICEASISQIRARVEIELLIRGKSNSY